jgi:hypothetical protein
MSRLQELFQDIANAIREQSGKNETLKPSTFANAIRNLPSKLISLSDL